MFLLINVKMPTIVGILTFMSGKNSFKGLSNIKKSPISCCFSLGAESRKKSYAKHFGYKLATGLHLKKNEF